LCLFFPGLYRVSTGFPRFFVHPLGDVFVSGALPGQPSFYSWIPKMICGDGSWPVAKPAILLREISRTSVDLCGRAGPAKSRWIDADVLQGIRVHLRDTYGAARKGLAVAVYALIFVVGLTIQKPGEQLGRNAVLSGSRLGVLNVARVDLPHGCPPVIRQRFLDSASRGSRERYDW